ncbi:glycerol-3-phosphate acyltransferase [Caldicellulosiruptor naganoensis]|uniref:Glycerol-3-phosphate acyltransferase n=1 Tax=Caldicellulosiruptor naganoensis TaxID=29324 RepID=A0ABY7BGX8_9FIRM|nr:glycerol-3-phosphate acyltransferase [Caldicellulosiruptor naganoensis]WAM32088.1 glycerol-3-phosphate acyltransferase [Caldicellulosiruptor naganoensis]
MIIVFSFISFLIGSIPFSYIITKKFFNKDITNAPDKNPGATNAFRIAGVKAGVPLLIFDISKGYFVAYIGKHILLLKSPDIYIVVFMVILGHAYSVFLHLKGGKSIAATTGILFALYGIFPVVFFALFTFWGLLMYKKDNLGTVIGIWSIMIWVRCVYLPIDDLIFLLLLGAFLTYRQLRTKPIEMDLIKIAKSIFKA